MTQGDSADDRFQVDIVRYGTRRARRSEVFLNYSLYGEPDGPIQMDYFFWILRNAAATVVVDTGFSYDGGVRARGRTMLAEPGEVLGLLGVPTEAPTLVVLTHAHYDHIGNLNLFEGCDITLARAEYEFWTDGHGRREQFAHSVEPGEIDVLRRADAGGRLRLVDGRTNLLPGIELIPVGGHTPGQLMVLVQTADGPVLLASDAIHYYEELDLDRPFTIVSDLPGMYDAFDLVRNMIDRGEVQHLVAGHDPATMRRFAPIRAVGDAQVTTIAASAPGDAP